MHPGKTLSDCVLSSAQLDGSLGRPTMPAKHCVRDGVASSATFGVSFLVYFVQECRKDHWLIKNIRDSTHVGNCMEIVCEPRSKTTLEPMRPWLPKIYRSLDKKMRLKLAKAAKRLKVTVTTTKSDGTKQVPDAYSWFNMYYKLCFFFECTQPSVFSIFVDHTIPCFLGLVVKD